MPPRMPTKEDFPPDLVIDIIPPSPPNRLSNMLILLHGLGDNHTPYTRLAQAIKLPETGYLTIRAPDELPMTNESMDAEKRMFHWGDDLIFNAQESTFESDVGFDQALQMLSKVVRDVVIGKCGFTPREVFVWGYAQGGGLGLRLVEVLEQGQRGDEETAKQKTNQNQPEFGGIISVGGPRYEPGSSDQKYGPSIKEIHDESNPDHAPARPPPSKLRTPILICRGAVNSAVSDNHVTRLKELFEHVQVATWKNGNTTGPGSRLTDFMPQNRDHMMSLMKFFARRLRSRKGIPEGAIEV